MNDPTAAAALAVTTRGIPTLAPATYPYGSNPSSSPPQYDFFIGGPGSLGAPSWWRSMYDPTLLTPTGATNKCSAVAGISASNPYFTGTNSLGATFIEGWNGANTIALAQSYPYCPGLAIGSRTVLVTGVVNGGWPIPDAVITLYERPPEVPTLPMPGFPPVTIAASQIVVDEAFTANFPNVRIGSTVYATMTLTNAVGSKTYASNSVTV